MQKPLWFKAKQYGWGWYPCTWQGWTILVVYLVILYFIAQNLLAVGFLTTVLLLVCYFAGEKPRWRWGSTRSAR
jgi:hypothetical protein